MIKRIFSSCALLLLFFNLLYFSFFYTKSYKVFSIQTELITENPTKVWYVYKNKYSNERIFSETNQIIKGKSLVFNFEIESEQEIDYIGLFWEAEKGSSIKVSSYSYKINKKSYHSNKNRNLINYLSKGSLAKTESDGVVIRSTNSNRNWIMLDDTSALNKKRDFKKHSFIPLIGNLLLCIGFIFYLLIKKPVTISFKLKPRKLSIEELKIYTLESWTFLMPFWIIASHVLMVALVALTLFNSSLSKSFSQLIKELKAKPLFFILYLWIIFSSLITSTNSQVLDTVVDYSYLLLMPVVFAQINKNKLKRILTSLEKGLLIYFVLLFIFTFSNFLKAKPDINFINFFELNLELFWHTSYFSMLIIIVFISKIKTAIWRNGKLILFYLFSLFFMYLVNARIPFIVGVILIGININTNLEKNILKNIFSLFTILLSGIMILFFLFKGHINNENSQIGIGEISSMDARLSIWKASFDEIGDHFIFGVGNKNTIDVISNSIDDKQNTKFRNYNSHNQFIEFFLGFGFPAFVILLLIFYKMFKNGNIYCKSFIFGFFVLFLVESYLFRQAGIILFTFWFNFYSKYKLFDE